MPKVKRMNMNEEIKKYQGRIYYYERATRQIIKADWIRSTNDYNHYEGELHHVVPYTDWEKNTKNVRSLFENNALILIERVMHQHLENPMYKLSKKEFREVYGINPDVILFDVNSKVERTEDSFLSHINDNQCPDPFVSIPGSNTLGAFSSNIEDPFKDVDLSNW